MRKAGGWMDKARIKAVLFDLDDTLQDRRKAFEKYCGYFLSQYFPGLNAVEFEGRRQQMEATVNGGYIDREVYFKRLIADWAWKDAPSPRELSEEYDRLFGHYVQPFEASKPVLVELRRRGYRTGIITNGVAILQNTKLHASGLRPYLDIAVVSGDVGIKKPDPGIFRLTAQRLGVRPGDCLYVGDHPVNDIEGALGAGMQAVWMQFGTFQEQVPQGVEMITGIEEILTLL